MSLRLKTILGVGIIEAVLLAVLITVVLNYMRLSSEENLENYVATTTTLFATTTKDAVLSFDLASLDYFVEEILTNEGVLYARIFDSNNNLLASNSKNNYVQRPFNVDKSYQNVDDDVYDNVKEIVVEGVSYGRIEMGFSIERIELAINEARKLAAIIAIIEMSLVALFSFLLGVYLTNQLKMLRNSARCVAAGDLDQCVHISAEDEVGEVAHAFNVMVSSLKEANERSAQYSEELTSLNKTLEERVKKRTAKIVSQKDKLESAYAKLQQAQKQLIQSEKMASIGQLAAGVAHEINNPVAFVKSNLSTLAEYIRTYQELINKQQEIVGAIDFINHNDLKEKIRETNEYIKNNDVEFINKDINTLIAESIEGTHRVSDIVQGLKVYSRASDDVMQACDINQCLQDTIKMLSNELKYKCEVITRWGELPMCQGNQGKLTQVFTNLIVNAAQAMSEMGTLTVGTAVIENEISITIADTGKGIDKEGMSKLFDPFFTTKPVGEGTGLGLSISQGIISDHKGKILVESEVDKGTVFTILLPVDP